MLYMLNSKSFYLIILLLILSIFGKVYGNQNTLIKWEPVYGAGGYIIEVIDSDDKTVIKKETRNNSLDVEELPIGTYKYNITTLNKLKKRGKNTGWLTLTIKKEDVVTEKKDTVKESSSKPDKTNFALGIGWEYNITLPEWSGILNNSYLGLNIYMSFPLSQIKRIKNIPFISSCGVEAQANISQYPVNNKSILPDFMNQALLVCGFHAGFNYFIPLDLISPKIKLVFNINPGLSYSKYNDNFKKSNSGNTLNPSSSLDFSLISGVSVRYLWTNSFFTDISAQYYRIFYISHPFDDIKLVLRIGILF